MRKPVIWIVCCLISFYSFVCSADVPSVVIDNQVITLPSYQGFQFIADPDSPVFKKLTELYVPKDCIPYGFYYETHPVNLNRVISVVQQKNARAFISKSKWKDLKEEIIKEVQQPIIKVSGNTKSERLIRSGLPQNKYHLIFTWETRFYTLNEKGMYDYHSSMLDAKDYIYLNGKLLILLLSITTQNPDVKLDNKKIYSWIALTFDATSRQIFENNPPTNFELSLERKAQIESFKAHWKLWLVVMIAAFILGWKAYTSWIPKIVADYRSKLKSKPR